MNNAEFTLKLIDKLNEIEQKGRIRLLLITREFGHEKCLDMVKEAKRRYATGEMIKDGSRQRTLGGCFFIQMTREERRLIERLRKEIKTNSQPVSPRE